jgi:Protein of unknown function, DUF481
MQKSNRLPGSLLVHARWVLIAVVALSGMNRACMAAAAPKPGTDVLVFSNGDQLTGTLLRSSGDKLVFHSDNAGDITVGWDKVKELRTTEKFAVVQKGQKLNKKTPDSEVPQGTLSVTNSEIQVQSAAGAASPAIPTKNADYVIDESSFQTTLRHEPSFMHGWSGAVTAGAAFVQATQTSQNFNVGIALVRAIPGVTWLEPRNRTTVSFTDIYGKVHQPGARDTKTSIFHGDAERDQYFSSRFYGLVDASWDHNYSQGLSLQQIYGAGVGDTVILQKTQQLDVKADIHYEHQSFSADTFAVPVPPAPPSLSLVGSSLGESYMRKLPAGLVFTEAGVVNISFNNTNAYSSNVAAGLVFPVYKRLSFNLGAVDSYLNNPPAGFKNNSFQFTAGVGYTLH